MAHDIDFQGFAQNPNAEGVRKFQPRVGSPTLGFGRRAFNAGSVRELLWSRSCYGFDRGLLDSLRIHTNGLPSFVPEGMTAYTSNNNVYYAKGEYDRHTALGIAVIGHEATHTQQYRQNGNLRFKAKYLFSSVVAGVGVTVGGRGSVMLKFDSARAYYGNKYEKEAANKEQQILNDLNQQYGGSNPCP